MQQIWQRIGFSKMEEMFTEWLLLLQMFFLNKRKDIYEVDGFFCSAPNLKLSRRPFIPFELDGIYCSSFFIASELLAVKNERAKDYIMEYTLFSLKLFRKNQCNLDKTNFRYESEKNKRICCENYSGLRFRAEIKSNCLFF